MAIYQLIEQDGEKTLVEVPSGGGSEAWGKYVEGTIPNDPSDIIANLPVGAFVVDDTSATESRPLALYNDEIWITESGTFTVPYSGWYEVLLIGGGEGSDTYKDSTRYRCLSGRSGRYKSVLVKLTADSEVDVTIGAGGAPYDNINNADITPAQRAGGVTTFGALSSDDGHRFGATMTYAPPNQIQISACGSGLGGGYESGEFYGAGGGTYINADGTFYVGYGHTGAVRLRFYNPIKAQ